MKASALIDATWPVERLSEGLSELLRRSGLGAGPVTWSAEGEVEEWIDQWALQCGCEAERLDTTFGDLRKDLAAAYPALIKLAESAYLLILESTSKEFNILTPALRLQRVSIDVVCGMLSQTAAAMDSSSLEQLLAESGINPRRRQRVLAALLNEQSHGKRFRACWTIRRNPGVQAGRALCEAGVMQHAGGLIAAHTVQYLLWLVSWALLGQLSFAGQVDRAWLTAWALLLLTLVPCQVITTWLQGLFAIGLGGFLKRRMLYGALKLAPEEMRHGGIGSFLGQALEAEAVETLALSGGVAGLLATIEIVLAGCVLGRFAIVLTAWTLITVFVALRFMKSYARWTDQRMELTEDLVESMVGHRTRLAQLRRGEWHTGEDESLQGYVGLSRSLDQTGAWLIAAIPRGWLLAGLGCIAPSVVAGHNIATETAVQLGGVLLAYTAFRRLTGSFADIAAAWVAWRKIAPLFHAAARPSIAGTAVANCCDRSLLPSKVIEAHRLSYRYRASGRPVLDSCSLTVRSGERILLEGPSGGGKTTLASLLTGVRRPDSGLLLANGLDLQTLGDAEWRRRIAAAPQFHENHILTDTLAFNLLMGRSWPPTQDDMQEAETVCRELGLGDLIDTMPSGLMQMVGEGGWQLSHGERSRVFIARSLLQSAELVILDESFAALDPDNARRSLECTMKRARTLMVIAHP